MGDVADIDVPAEASVSDDVKPVIERDESKEQIDLLHKEMNVALAKKAAFKTCAQASAYLTRQEEFLDADERAVLAKIDAKIDAKLIEFDDSVKNMKCRMDDLFKKRHKGRI